MLCNSIVKGDKIIFFVRITLNKYIKKLPCNEIVFNQVPENEAFCFACFKIGEKPAKELHIFENQMNQAKKNIFKISLFLQNYIKQFIKIAWK